MFSKTSLAFLVIGALWVNVSAIPIPADGPPDEYGLGGMPVLHYNDPYAYPPSARPGDMPGPPNQGLRVNKKLLYWGELPRSFSALSYRDLTFVFSVVAGGLVGTGIIAGGTTAAILSHPKGQNTTGTTGNNNNNGQK